MDLGVMGALEGGGVMPAPRYSKDIAAARWIGAPARSVTKWRLVSLGRYHSRPVRVATLCACLREEIECSPNCGLRPPQPRSSPPDSGIGRSRHQRRLQPVGRQVRARVDPNHRHPEGSRRWRHRRHRTGRAGRRRHHLSMPWSTAPTTTIPTATELCPAVSCGERQIPPQSISIALLAGSSRPLVGSLCPTP